MEFDLIAVTPRSVTIELKNRAVHLAPEAYDLVLDGLVYKRDVTVNVVSIYGLQPDTVYTVRTVGHDSGDSYQATLKTSLESFCLNVRKFGAKGDGNALDSTAIQAAIQACPKGGTVHIPEGVYSCGPLFLKSHMTLELAKGAVILGHTDRSLYPILPGYITSTDENEDLYLGSWEGNPLDCHASLITAIDVTGVSIIGEGTIDGNAQNSDWWIDPKVKRDAWRPRTVFFKGCSHMLIQGITVTNSPSWTLHPYMSDHLEFIDLNIINHKDSPNTDGLDPESCSHVKIIGVRFSVGDDCIAIKSGKLYMGRKLKRPSEKFIIRNCRMRHGHGAVVIGSEMSGGIRDIHVSRCLFEKTDRGLRIKTRRGRGEDGIIDGIEFDTIEMREVLTPFVINMFYFCDPDGKSEYVWTKDRLPVDEWTPRLGRFEFRHIVCSGCEVAAGYFCGLPEQPIECVLMQNVSVAFKEEAFEGTPAMMTLIEPMKQRGIIAENVSSLYLDDVTIENYHGDYLTAVGVDRIRNYLEE